MEWLNCHHLLYFWTVVREGGIAAASRDKVELRRTNGLIPQGTLVIRGTDAIPVRVVRGGASAGGSAGREVRGRPGGPDLARRRGLLS